MNYIVVDLEWNQSNTGKEPEAKEIPFEIIDIGAVKLNSKKVMTGEFNQLVKPAIYQHMHKVTGDLIHLHMKDLQKGRPFPAVMEEFLSWCGENYIFCTWGPLDLFEIQRNMHFYHMHPLSDVPIRFLDVQKLFSIAYEDGKSRRGLEYAVDYLKIEKISLFTELLMMLIIRPEYYPAWRKKCLRIIPLIPMYCRQADRRKFM